MKRLAPLLLTCLLAAIPILSCEKEQPLDLSALRGIPLETLTRMREDILARHADGSALSKVEAANVALLRDQERRLGNAWIFGEWRERHGARLLFRDDGTVTVGARGGEYDELGVYKFISPEQPPYESVWSVVYDAGGNPVVLVEAKGQAPPLVYPFEGSRTSVREQAGDLSAAIETGFYFSKVRN